MWTISWCPAPAISPEEKKEEIPALEVATGNIGDTLPDSHRLLVLKDSLSPGL